MASITVNKKPQYTVHPAPFPIDSPGFYSFSSAAFYSTLVGVPALIAYALPWTSLWTFPVAFVLCLVPLWISYVVADSFFQNWAHIQTRRTAGLKLTDYFEFHDASLAKRFEKASAIPMVTFFEAYFVNKISIKADMLDILEHRHDWASFRFTWETVKFIISHLLPEASFHTRDQDKGQVREHYDRGNDFYNAFLGPMMVYTSGIICDTERRETLEEMQLNKLDLVCNKLNLVDGEKMLDIGCGWGTLAVHAALKYGAKVTAVTLAKEQTEWGLRQAEEAGVSHKVKILCQDYRDIPAPTAPGGTKFDKITCVEMAEHVGIRRFNCFLRQVFDLLEDDGIFYLQIAGLRRPWQYEDLSWGLFMNKYIFPGADASCPLFWVVNQLEYAGFEVQAVDTIGTHYSATLERWYRNWLKPEHAEKIKVKYGEKWWKIWEFFLAWSTIASRQGSATCYMIVAHKNTNAFDRTKFMNGYYKQRLTASVSI